MKLILRTARKRPRPVSNEPGGEGFWGKRVRRRTCDFGRPLPPRDPPNDRHDGDQNDHDNSNHGDDSLLGPTYSARSGAAADRAPLEYRRSLCTVARPDLERGSLLVFVRILVSLVEGRQCRPSDRSQSTQTPCSLGRRRPTCPGPCPTWPTRRAPRVSRECPLALAVDPRGVAGGPPRDDRPQTVCTR